MKKKKQKWRAGDVVSITLDDGRFAFGRVLNLPLMAFYDYVAIEVPPIQEIIAKEVIFRVWVMKYAVTSGAWPIIGFAPLTPELETTPVFFKQNRITGALQLYFGAGQERPASPQEVQGLERAAVWEPEHIVDRLRDHFAGRENIWVRSLKPELR